MESLKSIVAARWSRCLDTQSESPLYKATHSTSDRKPSLQSNRNFFIPANVDLSLDKRTHIDRGTSRALKPGPRGATTCPRTTDTKVTSTGTRQPAALSCRRLCLALTCVFRQVPGRLVCEGVSDPGFSEILRQARNPALLSSLARLPMKYSPPRPCHNDLGRGIEGNMVVAHVARAWIHSVDPYHSGRNPC